MAEYGFECCDNSSVVGTSDLDDEDVGNEDDEAAVDLELLCRFSPKDDAKALIEEPTPVALLNTGK